MPYRASWTQLQRVVRRPCRSTQNVGSSEWRMVPLDPGDDEFGRLGQPASFQFESDRIVAKI
jgi:hypothetical protein